MELEITCKCGKGNVVLDGTYHDTSVMTCTVCDNKETVNCYYVDELLDLHTFNTSITKDVKFLNSNGKWTSNHDNHFIEKSKLDAMLKGYTSICEVDCEETITYYRKDFNFIKVSYNPIHKWYRAYKFVAKEESIGELVDYFLNN